MANPITTPFKDTFTATNIRNYRKSSGASLNSLAKLTGLSHTQIWGWEIGRYDPTVEKIKRLCDPIGVDYILFISGLIEFPPPAPKSKKRWVKPGSRFRLTKNKRWGRFTLTLTYSDLKEMAERLELSTNHYNSEIEGWQNNVAKDEDFRKLGEAILARLEEVKDASV